MQIYFSTFISCQELFNDLSILKFILSVHLIYVRSILILETTIRYYKNNNIYQTSKHVSTRLDLEFQCWCVLNKTPFLEPTNILKIYRMQVCAEDDKCISCQYRTLWNEIHYISSATYFFLSVYYNISTIYIYIISIVQPKLMPKIFYMVLSFSTSNCWMLNVLKEFWNK